VYVADPNTLMIVNFKNKGAGCMLIAFNYQTVISRLRMLGYLQVKRLWLAATLTKSLVTGWIQRAPA